MLEPLYTRMVLKLSGESLKGSLSHGIDPDALAYLADEIKQASKGVQLAVVVGGGNF